MKDQAKQNPGMEQGDDHRVPLLAEELLTVGRCWEKESQSSSRLWPLKDWLCTHAPVNVPTHIYILATVNRLTAFLILCNCFPALKMIGEGRGRKCLSH